MSHLSTASELSTVSHLSTVSELSTCCSQVEVLDTFGERTGVKAGVYLAVMPVENESMRSVACLCLGSFESFNDWVDETCVELMMCVRDCCGGSKELVGCCTCMCSFVRTLYVICVRVPVFCCACVYARMCSCFPACVHRVFIAPFFGETGIFSIGHAFQSRLSLRYCA